MLPAEIEMPLSRIETQCEAVAAALIDGEPLALQTASDALRQAAQEFSALLEQRGEGALEGKELRARIKRLSAQLGIQREGLLRRAAVAERTLHALVPSARKETYTGGRAAAGYRGFAA